MFGGPRTGKTGWLAGRVLDAPGATVVTSTRTDLYELTRGLRARRGPVHVFNAVGLGGIASTVCFDPVQGCEDPVTAGARASDLLAAGSVTRGGDREYWETQARRVLAAFLHTAALGGRDMHAVLAWVADPDEHEHELTSWLRTSPVPSFVQDATQFLTTNERTRSSITSTVMPALGWLTSPAASAAASRHGGLPALDVEELLRTRATVYLLGAEESQAAPLVCALTEHIAREARRLAARKSGGRLDPPLLAGPRRGGADLPGAAGVLDRGHGWTRSRDRGCLPVPGPARRKVGRDRGGDHPEQHRLGHGVRRTRDRDDLDYWSALAGERDKPVATTDDGGVVLSRTVRRVPVIAPAQLANLPFGRVPDLEELGDWLAAIYLRYSDAVLPSCWAWHADTVEELHWLRGAYNDAYGLTPADAGAAARSGPRGRRSGTGTTACAPASCAGSRPPRAPASCPVTPPDSTYPSARTPRHWPTSYARSAPPGHRITPDRHRRPPRPSPPRTTTPPPEPPAMTLQSPPHPRFQHQLLKITNRRTPMHHDPEVSAACGRDGQERPC